MGQDAILWLRKAKEDHKTALILFENERLEDCAVYSHQAVEKSLKAFYLYQHGEVPKVHDVAYLAKKLELPEQYIEFCIKVTPAYFAGRYPDAPGYDEKLFTKEECHYFVQTAGEIVLWIENKLLKN